VQSCQELASCGWPVLVRKTGGGVIPQGPGTLNVSLAFALDSSEQPTIAGVYNMFCAPLINMLTRMGCSAYTSAVPDCFCDGEYNVAVGGKKVIGTAQRWTRVKLSAAHGAPSSRQIIFAHALMLVNADLHGGVAAINQLYRASNVSSIVKLDAHANIGELVTNRGDKTLQQNIVEILNGLYTAELCALTA